MSDDEDKRTVSVARVNVSMYSAPPREAPLSFTFSETKGAEDVLDDGS